MFLEISQNSQGNNCVGVCFFLNKITGLQVCNFIKKNLQVFSFEICGIFRNTSYFEEHLPTTSSSAQSLYNISQCHLRFIAIISSQRKENIRVNCKFLNNSSILSCLLNLFFRSDYFTTEYFQT